jgi:FdhE protein
MEEGRLSHEALCAALLREEDSYFSQRAEELSIDQNFMAFMAYHSLRPSLKAAAIALAPLVDEAKGWERGICPICGSGPAIALLRNEGKRLLVCSLCAHQWPARRLVCPFCEESDPRRLRYAFSDEEPEYRTELCDGCRTYLKTFDLRKIARPIYLPLEQVASLHLDVQAIQDGYRSRGIGLALPLTQVSCIPDAS